MLRHVIAVHMEQEKVCGYRIFDAKRLDYSDYSASDIVKLFINSKDFEIGNLEYNGKELVFKGASSKRFPILCNGICIENKYKATVIGRQSRVSNTEYCIVNYEGKLVRLSEYKTIQYAEDYGLTNMKVVDKEKVKYLASLHGHLAELDTEPKFYFTDSKVFYVSLPIGFGETLKIPSLDSGGIAIAGVDRVEVNKSGALSIHRLVLPKLINIVGDEWSKAFINLREVDISNSNVHILNGAFRNSGIEVVKTNGAIVRIGKYAFSGCKNLRDIECRHKIQNIDEYAFDGCENIDVQRILDKSTSLIMENAFNGCKSDTGVLNVSELRSMTVEAFNGINGLRELNILNPMCKILLDTNKSYNVGSDLNKIKSTNKLGLTIGLYPGSPIIPYVGSGVKIKYLEIGDKLSSFLTRANMANMNISLYTAIDNAQQANLVLSHLDQETISSTIKNHVAEKMPQGIEGGLLRYGLLHIYTTFGSIGYLPATKLLESKDALIIKTDNGWAIVPYNKSFLIADNVRSNEKVNKAFNPIQIGLDIRPRVICNSSDLRSVSVDNTGKLVAVMGSGKKYIFKPGDSVHNHVK